MMWIAACEMFFSVFCVGSHRWQHFCAPVWLPKQPWVLKTGENLSGTTLISSAQPPWLLTRTICRTCVLELQFTMRNTHQHIP